MRITFSFAGALRTGGLLLLACVSLPLLAQQRANRPVEKSARVIERGAHHATWETVRELADPLTGETVSVTNSYVQLESGLHFQDVKGEWLEASDQIEIVSGHAVAKQGQHQARWAANINTFGAIELWTPEGELARSHVLGLAFYDPTTGESSMIAEIKDSIGVVTGNQVIYEDAFDGVVADLRYTYTKAGFVQDVILREQLPDPVELGFDPATVQVQVLTEFVELPAVTRETVDAALLSARTNQLSEAVSAARYAQDGDLRLGTMTMNQGRAFSLPATERESAPVRKALERFEGNRNILLETVEYEKMQADLIELPPASKPTALRERSRSEQQAALRKAPAAPQRQLAAASEPLPEGELMMAKLDATVPDRRGYLIDYDLNAGTTNSLTLQGDTTYYVTGLVTATNITTIEGGTVVKFASTNNAELKIKGTIKCLTGPYRPAIFTAKDDDSVGQVISGSTGNPTGYYALRALNIDDNTSDLRYVHIRHAKQGVYYGSASAYPHFLRHVQVTQSGEGVVSLSPVFHVQNALLYNVVTNFTTTGSGITGHVEQVTVNQAGKLNGSGSLTLNVTNSLLMQITNSSTYAGSGNAALASNSGVFQTVGAGGHYLPSGSGYRNAGVTNISYRLVADFRTMTTTGPTVFSNIVISASTTLAPLVARDSDVPDLGYHYAPLDYVIGGTILTNATLTLTNGVAVGIFTPTSLYYGLRPTTGSQVISEGTPINLNTIARYYTVQEEANSNWKMPDGNNSSLSLPATGLSASFRFTRWVIMAPSDKHLNLSSSHGGQFSFTDCEFVGGRQTLYQNMTAKNCLFDRVYVSIANANNNTSPIDIWNSTFNGGTVALTGSGSYGTWTIKDNLFFKPTISQTSVTPSHGNNGYITGFTRITSNQASDKVVSAFSFDQGPMGRFYIPDTASMTNAGSRSATNAGLFHYTIQSN